MSQSSQKQKKNNTQTREFDTRYVDRWLLPEGVEEVLPAQAAYLERLRREILDLLQSWGYELVIPPLMEFLESLLTGAGHDLDLQTFKITDQRSGRLMGIRADMTPQVARIDAHRLQQQGPTRLCYLGPVLQANPRGLSESRNPLQIGAELFGHAGIESDVEVICLMLAMLKQAGIESVFIDFSHMGIFRGLIEQARLDSYQEQQLFDVLQRKAVPELQECLSDWQLPADIAGMLSALVDLYGDKTVLADAREVFASANNRVRQALADLTDIVEQVAGRVTDLKVNIDLAELRGFHYHTGVMFAAYTQGHGQALARGGRYDEIGQVFGRARPATGFSTDLKTLVHNGRISIDESDRTDKTVICPWSSDPDLIQAVAALRTQGVRVINELPGHDGEIVQGLKKLQKINGKWAVK